MAPRLRDVVVVACAVLASCRANDVASAADRDFVARMNPHHVLGLELVELATTRATDVRLRRLVFEMGGYHHHESDTLTAWSREWDVSDAADFPGHLSETELKRLESTTGDEFDTLWLVAMIEHHEGALVIARDAVVDSARDEIRSMAATTIEVQSRELDAMRELCQVIPRPCFGR